MVPGLVFLLFPGGSAPDSWRYLIRGVRNNVCPLYWRMSPGPGESAADSWKFGSLSRGKMAKWR